ncbi:MAG: GTP-binding protein HflX [Thermoleophilia bacterium]|nr:GTP-binding protein HflX [Thermoleophilia bacterium]
MSDYNANMTERPAERAVVAAMIAPQADEDTALEEIRELLRTAGVLTDGTIVQRREDQHAGTYLGSGKLEELKRLVEHVDPDVVVIDDALTPRQQRTLEDKLERRVLDRTAVILDIFAQHAKTAEGKVQVELAQLEYNMSRMRGMWKHLERLGAGGGNAGPGVGTRGPGESQLETDRRLARNRVALLNRKLRELEGRRTTQRASRQNSIIPKVALAGYTNAGKSTLLNALTGAEVSMANRLFETLDPTTRAYERDGRRYLVTDTVGFIERLPTQLVDAFKSTLEETLLANLVVIVADGSAEEVRLQQHLEAVRAVLEQIGAGKIPTVLALNKSDRLDATQKEQLQRRYPDAVIVAARTGDGLPALMERIAASFASQWTHVDLVIPYAEAGLLSELYEAGTPVERADMEDGIHASAHLPERLLKKVDKYRIDAATAAAAAEAFASMDELYAPEAEADAEVDA